MESERQRAQHLLGWLLGAGCRAEPRTGAHESLKVAVEEPFVALLSHPSPTKYAVIQPEPPTPLLQNHHLEPESTKR